MSHFTLRNRSASFLSLLLLSHLTLNNRSASFFSRLLLYHLTLINNSPATFLSLLFLFHLLFATCLLNSSPYSSCILLLLPTGQHHTSLVPVGLVQTGYKYVSDCRSRSHKFNPGPVPYFHLDLSWTNFYCHFPPFCWIIQEGLLSVTNESMCKKYSTGYLLIHACPEKNVVRWFDHSTMTIAIDLGHKATKRLTLQNRSASFISLHFLSPLMLCNMSASFFFLSFLFRLTHSIRSASFFSPHILSHHSFSNMSA